MDPTSAPAEPNSPYPSFAPGFYTGRLPEQRPSPSWGWHFFGGYPPPYGPAWGAYVPPSAGAWGPAPGVGWQWQSPNPYWPPPAGGYGQSPSPYWPQPAGTWPAPPWPYPGAWSGAPSWPYPGAAWPPAVPGAYPSYAPGGFFPYSNLAWQSTVSWAPPRRQLERKRLLPTLLVAAVIAAMVLVGMGIDFVTAAPSIGAVQVGAGVTFEGAPGWISIPDPSDSGATALQKGDAILLVTAQDASNTTARQELERYVAAEEADGVSFGDIRDISAGRYDAAIVSFHGVSSVAYDGEAIMVVANGKAVLFEAAAPQGYFEPAAGDLETMADSVEVGP